MSGRLSSTDTKNGGNQAVEDLQAANRADRSAPLARDAIGQSRMAGQLLAQLRQADWTQAKSTAASVYGVGTLAIAEARAAALTAGGTEADAAAAAYRSAFGGLGSQEQQEFLDRLNAAVSDPDHHGDLLPAVLQLLSTGDATGLTAIYEANATRASTAGPAALSAISSAIGMASMGLRSAFWASFNLAYGAANPAQSPESTLVPLTALLESEAGLVHDHGVGVHTGAARRNNTMLDAACDGYAAMAPRVSASLSIALGSAVRVVDAHRANGRDNDTLRRLHRTTTLGLALAHQAFAGHVASYVLQTHLDGWWTSPVAERLLAHARTAPAIAARASEHFATTLPEPDAVSGQPLRIEGRVTGLAASRIGRKLVTHFTVSVGRNRQEIPCLAEFHDLGHEGLTVGAWVQLGGKSVEENGATTLRVGRVSLSDPVRDGWINAWYALAKPWAELSPGDLDIQWSPGRGDPVTPDAQASGVGVGEVIYNKPVPRGGLAHVRRLH